MNEEDKKRIKRNISKKGSIRTTTFYATFPPKMSEKDVIKTIYSIEKLIQEKLNW